MSLLPLIIRSKFRATSRAAADDNIWKESELTLALASQLTDELSTRSVRVPKMIGIDEDMRDWSICQTLEHNVIVNHSITGIVVKLANEENIVTDFDPKNDVMPSSNSGTDQIEAFAKSVDDHLRRVESLANLRSKTTFPHPLFGNFNAHQWHCMFGFHLMLHRKQIAKASDLIKAA